MVPDPLKGLVEVVVDCIFCKNEEPPPKAGLLSGDCPNNGRARDAPSGVYKQQVRWSSVVGTHPTLLSADPKVGVPLDAPNPNDVGGVLAVNLIGVVVVGVEVVVEVVVGFAPNGDVDENADTKGFLAGAAAATAIREYWVRDPKERHAPVVEPKEGVEPKVGVEPNVAVEPKVGFAPKVDVLPNGDGVPNGDATSKGEEYAV